MNVTHRRSRLRRAREVRGLTQERAAVAAGISVAWLRQLERDPSLLSADVAARLLPVLGLDRASDADGATAVPTTSKSAAAMPDARLR